MGLVNYLVPYGAAFGNRQLRQDREIVAAVLRQLVCDLCGDCDGAQRLCYLCRVSSHGAASGNRQLGQHREIVALMPNTAVSATLVRKTKTRTQTPPTIHWHELPMAIIR